MRRFGSRFQSILPQHVLYHMQHSRSFSFSQEREKREYSFGREETLWNTGEKRGPTLFLNKFFLAKNLALANSEIHHQRHCLPFSKDISAIVLAIENITSGRSHCCLIQQTVSAQPVRQLPSSSYYYYYYYLK